MARNLVGYTTEKAYKEVFEKAVIEYNNKQKRNDRKITDYYQKIRQDKKKHLLYEMICGVYEDNITSELSHEILYEYAKNFQERHPNLKVTGIYFHADEEGKAPHIHIDYFPVAEMKKGMALQNSLVKALEQEGFMSGKKYNNTAQIKFEHSENAILENICNKYGFEVEHPQVNMKVEHLDTAVYKKKKEIESLEIEKLDLQDEVEYLTSEKEEITHNISKYKKQRDLLYSFISKVLVCFLPEKVIDYIFDVIGKNTWTEVETSIQAEIDMLEHQNDKDITDDF